MKRTTRSLLITALILFCTGLLISLIFSLVAKINGVKIFDFEKKASTIESIFVENDDILSKSPESNFVKKLSKKEYSRIDVSSFVGDVTLCKSDKKNGIDFKNTNTNNISYTIVGDTLIVKETDPVGIFGLYIGENGFSFRGLRHIFATGNRINAAKKITIYVPSKIELDKIEISSSVGDVKLDGVSAPEVNITSTIGNVEVENSKNEKAKFKITGNFTDIRLKNNIYASCSVSTKFGNISAKIPKHAEQSNMFDIWIGDVKVNTKLPIEDYKLSISATIGSVSKNKKSCGNKLNEPGMTSSRISSDILLGNFSISSKEKPKKDESETVTSEKIQVTEEIPETAIAS